jgi:putative membrane protein
MVHQAASDNLNFNPMKKIITLILSTGLAISMVYGQVPDPDTTARHFIIMASIGNWQEVGSGKLAAQKAIRADVKSFGQMMVTDHSDAEQKLLQLSKSRGYRLPQAATDTPPPDMNLSKASGDDFDRMYIHAMVSGHRNTVMMFQNYAITGKDPEVRAFAAQMLPTLKAHLAAIKAIDEKYKNLTAK